jgi:hypothetical protein
VKVAYLDYSTAGSPNEALHWAIEMMDFEAVELMLMNGFAPNARGHGGCTALQHAIDIEADAAIQNDWAVTPVRFTALLLAYGADPLLEDDDGKDALLWASDGHRQALALMQRVLGRPRSHELSPNGTQRAEDCDLRSIARSGSDVGIVRCASCRGTFDRHAVWESGGSNVCSRCVDKGRA